MQAFALVIDLYLRGERNACTRLFEGFKAGRQGTRQHLVVVIYHSHVVIAVKRFVPRALEVSKALPNEVMTSCRQRLKDGLGAGGQ